MTKGGRVNEISEADAASSVVANGSCRCEFGHLVVVLLRGCAAAGHTDVKHQQPAQNYRGTFKSFVFAVMYGD